jgi:hypothetical protein
MGNKIQSTRAVPIAVVLVVAYGAALAQDLPAEPPVHQWRQGFLKVELQPLLPDQTTAFFLARGFAAVAAADFAKRACVFRATIGNAATNLADPVIDLDLKSWAVEQRGASKSFPVQEDWDEEWQGTGVEESARIAFRWALFPPKQTFSASDYNWGMLTFGLSPGSRFHLLLRWRENGMEQEGRIDDLECASHDS